MSLPLRKQTGYTIEEWKTWEGRWELINGVAYDMTPAPNLEHQRVSMGLSVAIFKALEEEKDKHGRDCTVLAAPIDLYLPGEQSVYQPDLVIVCGQDKLVPHGIEGAPDLVVEILSPSTSGKDLIRKRWAYEAGGIPEYLIIDPVERVGLLLRLEGGRYEEAAHIEWGGMMPLLGGTLNVVLE